MKLELFKSILESSASDSSGALTSYGMILNDPSGYKIDYDEIDGIQIFTDKSKFEIAIAKLYSEFTGNKDDVFLMFDEISDQPDFDDFCERVWMWDSF